MPSSVLHNNILRVLCVLAGEKCRLILPALSLPAGSSHIAQPGFGYGCNVAEIDRTGQVYIRPFAVVQNGTVCLISALSQIR